MNKVNLDSFTSSFSVLCEKYGVKMGAYQDSTPIILDAKSSKILYANFYSPTGFIFPKEPQRTEEETKRLKEFVKETNELCNKFGVIFDAKDGHKGTLFLLSKQTREELWSGRTFS